MQVESDGLDIFNVGTMRGTSVERVAQIALLALGQRGEIREASDRVRPGKSEIYELVADNRRARELLGWSPAVSLEEGLRLTIAGTPR